MPGGPYSDDSLGGARHAPTPMHHVIRTLVAAATLAAACTLAFSSRADGACGNGGYSYAGVSSVDSRAGVSAAITVLRAPAVTLGHVAAWVGVGGKGLGPNGTEWLQVGISAEPGQGPSLYDELARPGVAPLYVSLAGHLTLGRSYTVAVLESRAHPGWWGVWVTGSTVTKPIYLPGSHDAWRPVATSESWDGGTAPATRSRSASAASASPRTPAAAGSRCAAR